MTTVNYIVMLCGEGCWPRHAYPAADDASPAAVGKLFSEQTWIFQFTMSWICARSKSSSSTSPSPSLCLFARRRTENSQKRRSALERNAAFLKGACCNEIHNIICYLIVLGLFQIGNLSYTWSTLNKHIPYTFIIDFQLSLCSKYEYASAHSTYAFSLTLLSLITFCNRALFIDSSLKKKKS